MSEAQELDRPCRCSCGSTHFTTRGKPLFALICHCSICQQFNQAPYGDVIVFAAADVQQPSAEMVDFQTYRPPPNVPRARCVGCGQAAVEVVKLPLMPKLVIVPRAMFAADTNLPDPRAHLFYDKRVTDVDDGLPKHSGYWRSQLAFFKGLVIRPRV